MKSNMKLKKSREVYVMLTKDRTIKLLRNIIKGEQKKNFQLEVENMKLRDRIKSLEAKLHYAKKMG